MRDIGFVEFRALGNEAVCSIEGHGMYLCVQIDIAHTGLPRGVDQFIQYSRAETLIAPGSQHRHTTDLAAFLQTTGGDDLVRRGAGQRMYCVGIFAVPLEVGVDMLFDDKYGLAYMMDQFLIAIPPGQT